MNCQQFDRRMQRELDRRGSPAAIPLLRRHAETCEPCRRRLALWAEIETVLSAPSAKRDSVAAVGPAGLTALVDDASRGDRPRSHAAGGWAVAMAIAGVLLAAVWFRAVTPEAKLAESPRADETTVDMATPDRADLAFTAGVPVWAGDRWVRDLADAQWIDQTMPAVRSVRDGVAPLGRSFLQVFSILSQGGGLQAS